MTRKTIIWGVMVLGCTVQAMSGTTEDNPLEYMSKEEREMLKEEARDMFYHAYNAYMDNAYPADELMPLSCKGRYRSTEPDRGDIDSTLGNFSLTLVDTLDTLVVLGDLGEFENAVRLVVKDVTFDTDVIVSLFETNIRMLGGLLSGHILAEYLQSRADIMPWYRGELLNLAKDLGYRFLPAFNTTTGIPFGRINLRHGMKGVPAEMCRETCTACAGSMILEMAALSRLTGESVFEDKAQKAMDALWKMRHRGTDLMGSVLNVHSGDWVRRDSGVGAGIDSYYEYCLKAYILLGDEKYLGRFNKHYQAVMKYVSQGPMLLDVHMHRPNTNSKNFMDALLAFWPGLQVLKGDIKPAVETHEMLYQVMQRHNFIPEAFTTDFQVHWGHHPLRPEFLESTYFLYRATGDHYYLGVGRKVLKSLQTYARVPCGYAAVSDVRTNKNDDTMDSFVLSETLKYLYLLFAEPNDLILDLDEFIFTTEGHLLPLTLAALRTNVTSDLDRDIVQVDELGRICPNSLHLFPASVRQPLRNMVEDVCPRRSLKRRLNASQFQVNNVEHLKILSNMGITILTPAAGRVQVLHTFSNARTALDAEEGLLFMQEVVELSKKQSEQSETRPLAVSFLKKLDTPPSEITLLACPAHFGSRLKDDKKVTGIIEFANPFEACNEWAEPAKLAGKIVVVARGNCMFVEKARNIQKAGAIAGIVVDSVPGSSAAESPMFAMSGDGKEPDDITIPVVFLFTREAAQLAVAYMADTSLNVTIGDYTPRDKIQLNAPGDLSVFERLKGSWKDFISQQLTLQNSANRATEKNPNWETLDVSGGQSRIEYNINDFHLKAVIDKETHTIRIMKTESPAPPPKPMKFLDNYEKFWYARKQDLVNDIYSSKDGILVIPLPMMQIQYHFIQRARGLETTEQISDSTLIKWLFKELGDISPDTTKSEKKADTTLEKLLKQLLHTDFLRNMNELMKYFESSAMRNEELARNPEDTKKDNPKEEIVDELNFSKELRDSVEVIESTKDTLKNNNVFEADEKSMIISRCNYQARYQSETNNVRITWIDNIKNPCFNKKKKSIIFSNEDFERTWYLYRQFLTNVIHSYDDKSLTTSISILELQYECIHMLRGTYNAQEWNIEKILEWYLGELGELRPTEKIVELLRDRRISRSLRNEWSLNSYEFINFLSAIEEVDLSDEKNNEELDTVQREDLTSTENPEETKTHIKNDETKNIDDASKVLKDVFSIFPGKINNDNGEKRIEEEMKIGDPMEEFKKPVWAPDDNKDRKFSRLQEKNHLSVETNEYTKAMMKDRTKRKKGSKRIQDDL